MLTEHRETRNKALIQSLNERVALISETLETFGPLKFMCECGIYACKERIELTVTDYEAVRLDPTHFLVHPHHVLHALELVVLEYPEGHAVVEQRVAQRRPKRHPFGAHPCCGRGRCPRSRSRDKRQSRRCRRTLFPERCPGRLRGGLPADVVASPDVPAADP